MSILEYNTEAKNGADTTVFVYAEVVGGYLNLNAECDEMTEEEIDAWLSYHDSDIRMDLRERN